MGTTKEQLHRLVDELPDSNLDAARDALAMLAQPNGSGEIPEPAWDIAELRASIGRPTSVVLAPPIKSVDQLIGDFWPEDEDIDEFVATVRRWRDNDRYTRLPD